MKRAHSIKEILKFLGLAFLGLFAMIFYFFKWLGQTIAIWIRDTKLVRKTLKVLIKIFEIIYMPVYYTVYIISIVLRFLICVCYFLMFNPRRAWNSLKLIFK